MRNRLQAKYIALHKPLVLVLVVAATTAPSASAAIGARHRIDPPPCEGLVSQSIAVGDQPELLMCADLDADGFPEIVTPLQAENRIAVRWNDRNGQFTAETLVSVSQPICVVSADIDSDGDADVIVGSELSSFVVIRNNGSRSLIVQQIVSTSSTAWLTTTDIDSDGDSDVVVANGTSGTVSIFKNNALGSFAHFADFPVGDTAYQYYCTSADVDGDGDPDVATVTRGNDGYVNIFLNSGDGTLAVPPARYPAGRFPSNVAFCDLDGDDDLDMASASLLDNNIRIRMNDSSGVYGEAVRLDSTSGTFFVATGDLDQDSDADIVACNYFGNNIRTWYNNGAGQLSFGSDTADGSGSVAVVIGDIDADSDIDVITSNVLDDSVRVFRNRLLTALTLQPESVSSCPGGSPFMVVSPGADAGTADFQWQRRDGGKWVSLVDGVDVRLGEVSGAQTDRIQFTGVDATASGSEFRCVVTTTCGTVTSVSAMLSVCRGDYNCDGVVNSTDVSDFINAWFDDQAKGTLVSDWDGNGVVNSTDVSEFINSWFSDVSAGCG